MLTPAGTRAFIKFQTFPTWVTATWLAPSLVPRVLGKKLEHLETPKFLDDLEMDNNVVCGTSFISNLYYYWTNVRAS